MNIGIWSAIAIAGGMVGLGAPAHAFIVNISGSGSGEQTGGDDCAYQSCEGALITPVQVTFGAGTYSIKDAYSPTTGLESGALYDSWDFEVGYGGAWVWHWKALLDDGADGATIDTGNYASHILLDVDASFDNDRFPTEADAAAFGANTAPSTLTFSAPTTVDFVVNDYYLPDNAGGISLDIENTSTSPGAIPEPASWALMLVGFAAIGGSLRRRSFSRAA